MSSAFGAKPMPPPFSIEKALDRVDAWAKKNL
jgi:hypothetical protein